MATAGAAVWALVVLLGTAFASATGTGADARPVSKVITLLKDMIAQMEKEADIDQEAYEAMGCWCETNDKEKTKAIADAEAKIASLQAAIEENTGLSSQLNTEIKNLNTEVTKNQQALDSATALREKQLAEFNQEEKDMLQSISSLKSAVEVLSKHNSFLQLPRGEATKLVVTLRDQLHRHRDSLSPMHAKVLTSFVQSPFDGSMVQTRGKTKRGDSYAPQSGEIFGIMSQMKESFETNLANSQKEETENVNAYNDLKSAKETEIAAGQDQAATKTNELADTDEKKAQDTQDLENTRETMAADSNFLADLKEKCATVDAEYEQRTTTRQLEIQAVSKALEFLSSDDAFDLFSNSLGTTFWQKSVESRQQNQLVKFLQDEAKRNHDPRLSELAIKTRLDKFAKVKETIQGMVDKLNKEKEDDIQHKDFCVDSINQNERDTSSKDRERKDLEAKIDDLAMTIDTAAKAIATLKAEVADLRVQMKKAGEEREKMNKEFQVTVADQRATQKLLEAALNVLKGFYDKKALIQERTSSGSARRLAQGQAPPPPGFKSYEKSNASGGVMAMIQAIIDDAKAMEAEAIKGEEESQLTYEAFVRDTNKSIEDKLKEIVATQDRKSKAEGEKVETEVSHDEVVSNLEGLTQENKDLHVDCDFLLKNFDIRATARDEEIEALKQGIAMFSGASFGALLQHQGSGPSR